MDLLQMVLSRSLAVKRSKTGVGAAMQKMDFLTALGIPHDVVIGRSITLHEYHDGIKGKGHFYTDDEDKLTSHELQLIRRVQQYARKTNLSFATKKQDVRWNRMTTVQGVYNGYTELDVTGAYWSVARNLGIISEEIYQLSEQRDDDGKLLISKRARLMALGSLAARKDVYHFDGMERKLVEVKEDKRLADMFFHIARVVGECMTEIYQECDCLGFWVDACIVRNFPANTEKAEQIASNYGLTLHEVELAPRVHIRPIGARGTAMYCIEIRDRAEERWSIRPKYYALRQDMTAEQRRVLIMDHLQKTLTYEREKGAWVSE